MSSRAVAFAPGRVNLIGEHTDYNRGLCLPFTLARGVTVRAQRIEGEQTIVHSGAFGEWDSFATRRAEPAEGWRAFPRGIVAALRDRAHDIPSTRLDVASDLPIDAGLSSSAAVEVALALALLALVGERQPDRLELARLCSGVEHEWAGAQSGLLDQLAALFGERERALLIDCASEELSPVPLELGGWTLATIDSGADRRLGASGYNERAAECARAAELLELESLRDATLADAERLPEPLSRRARHVIGENARVRAAVKALADGDFDTLGSLLDASHASLRDDFEVSMPAVEATVARAHDAGAAGARLMGGGFGGSVLALFGPGVAPPDGALVASVGPAAWAASLSD